MTAVAEGQETRACSKCHETKPASEFLRTSNHCRACRTAYGRQWRVANREKFRAYRADPAYKRRHFLRKHSLTPERFEELFDAQGRACAICRSPEPNGRGWHIDHDHTCCPSVDKPRCGKCFRGILCHSCNVGLGHFGDDAERLLAAIRYLGVKAEA